MTTKLLAVSTVRKLVSLAAVAVFGLGAQFASADPIYFDFSGACTIECASIGASNGDAVSGFFETDTAAVLSGVIDTGEIVAFSFQLGDILLDSSLGVVNFAELVLNAAGDGFSSGRMTIIQGPSVFVEFEFLDAWIFAQQGEERAGGYGEFAVRVPEPGTLMLLGIGLAGIGLARRRKTA